MDRNTRWSAAFFAAAFGAAVLMGVGNQPSVAEEAAPQRTCQEVTIPVRFDGTIPTQMHAEYCQPTGPPARGVQVLVHGATYDGGYWTQAFDYPAVANASGYATLAIDKIGYGRSTHLASALLTASGQANAIHQIVSALRAGRVDDREWDEVVLVGHSMGSGQVAMAAAAYHDVDAVVLSGMTHHVSPDTLLRIVLSQVRPAPLDSATRERWPLDAGMLTTIPGQRTPLFHADALPAVAARDEATKGVVSAVEISETVVQGFTLPVSRAIDVPVLLVNGSEDAIFCTGLLGVSCSSAGGLAEVESPYFAPEAQLETRVVDGAGHCLQMSPNAPAVADMINGWLNHRQT